jgi:hypothetical protein
MNNIDELPRPTRSDAKAVFPRPAHATQLIHTLDNYVRPPPPPLPAGYTPSLAS